MSSEKKNEALWWESAEDHRFALEVLQLPLRRKMLRIIAGGIKNGDQIAKEVDLSLAPAEYHLQMLEKALVIEQKEGGWMVTPTGRLYLKHVEARS
jgi:predicted transcriptional regulator